MCASAACGRDGSMMHHGKKSVEVVCHSGQCSAEKLMSWVTLTHTASANKVHLFLSVVFLNGSGPATLQTSEWLREMLDGSEEFKVLTWPPNSSDLNLIEYLRNVKSMET